MTSTYSARRHAASLDIITRALTDIGHPYPESGLRIHFAAVCPCGTDHHDVSVRRQQIHEIAERIFTALYGRLRPADTDSTEGEDHDDAAIPMNFGGMAFEEQFGALAETPRPMKAYRDDVVRRLQSYDLLQSEVWYPLRAGDMVHVAYQASGDQAAFGETYQVRDSEGPLVLQDLVLIGHTAPDSAMSGHFEVRDSHEPLVEMWAEAGADCITVVRDGVVLHNGVGMKAA